MLNLTSEVMPMDDKRIIELFFARDERAIEETRASYGPLLRSVAMSILANRIDSEECESDTYFRAWNSIPPNSPKYLAAYLVKITRNLALNRMRDQRRRAPVKATLILDELAEIIPNDLGDPIEDIALRDAMRDFVGGLEVTKRRIFLQRYFYMRSVREIADDMDLSAGTVKSHLSRTRILLRDYLTERGINI